MINADAVLLSKIAAGEPVECPDLARLEHHGLVDVHVTLTPAGQRFLSQHVPGFDLRAFANQAKASACRSKTGRCGERKVFVSHAFRQFKRDGHATGDVRSLHAFKAHLIDANREGLLSLSRADLVESMDPRDVAESEIRYLGSRFNFVRIDR